MGKKGGEGRTRYKQRLELCSRADKMATNEARRKEQGKERTSKLDETAHLLAEFDGMGERWGRGPVARGGGQEVKVWRGRLRMDESAAVWIL